ncbi:hypothetical protein GCM10009790_26080 [Georgenia ruanii]
MPREVLVLPPTNATSRARAREGVMEEAPGTCDSPVSMKPAPAAATDNQ